MIAENRHIFCVSFVKFYRRFVFKKELTIYVTRSVTPFIKLTA